MAPRDAWKRVLDLAGRSPGAGPCALALLIFALTVVVSKCLQLWLGAGFMMFPLAGLLVTGLLVGTRLALLSIPPYAVALIYCFFEPVGSFGIAHTVDRVRLIAFSLIGAVIAAVSGYAQKRYREARAEAEERAGLLSRVEESERRFRMLAENAPDAVVKHVIHPEHRVEYLSPAWSRLTGYDEAEHYADHELCEKLVLPEDRPAWRKIMSAEEGATDERPVVVRWRRRDGTIIWTEQRRAVLRDEAGRAVAIQAIIRDVTDRVETEQERDRLQQENRRRAAELRALLDSTTTGLVLYDVEGRLVAMNKAAQLLFPLTERERELIDRERLPLLTLKASWVDGRPISLDEGLRIRRGEMAESTMDVVRVAGAGPHDPPRVLSVSAAPIVDDGGTPLGTVTAFSDITRVHELQEEREDLLRAVSHDLRTPLQAILLHAGAIERAVGPDDHARGSARSIVENGKRMGAAIQEVLDMARLAAGEMRPQPEDVPLGGFLRGMVARLFADGDLTRLRLEVPEDVCVRADPQHLERILSNLIGNAFKYAPGPSPVVVRATPGAERVTISVVDDGPGLSSDEQAKLFKRFSRSARAQRKDSLGLGLYVVKVLSEAQGGSASLRSAPGCGCEFDVILPRGKAAAQPSASAGSRTPVRVES